MIKIVFNDGANCDAKFRRTSTNLITLIGDIPSNTTGFKAYSRDTLLGDYSDFKTIYKVKDDGKVFSNDGSVEPMKTVTVKAVWNGGETYIPNTILINTNRDVNTLSKPDWEKEYVIPESESLYLTDAGNVEHFQKVVSGLTVTYTYSEVGNE